MSTSWRDSVSEEAQNDMDSLLDMCLQFSVVSLAKHGEVRPFAAYVDVDGDARFVGFSSDDEIIDPKRMCADLVAGLRSSRETMRAGAVCCAIRLDDADAKAIRVALESREEVSLAVDMPYFVSKLGSPPHTGDLVVHAAMRNIWSDQPTL